MESRCFKKRACGITFFGQALAEHLVSAKGVAGRWGGLHMEAEPFLSPGFSRANGTMTYA